MKLLVTSRSPVSLKHTVLAIKRVMPRAEVRKTNFRGVYLVEAEGDPFELAMELSRYKSVGRVVVLLEETASDLESIKRAALRVSDLLKKGESFCFRLRKRGAHDIMPPTPEVEREVGALLVERLKARFGIPPEVELERPDVVICAEILGGKAFVGISRPGWRRSRSS